MSRKRNGEKIDEKTLKKSVDYAKKQPRLAFYSPVAAAILNYRKSTIPRYSISDELSKIVEGALRERYPTLTQRVKKLMKSGNKATTKTLSKLSEREPSEKA